LIWEKKRQLGDLPDGAANRACGLFRLLMRALPFVGINSGFYIKAGGVPIGLPYLAIMLLNMTVFLKESRKAMLLLYI
jgi:hypothetical protein